MGFESPEKLLLVVLVAAFLLAPSRLPELGRALGQGIREFKAGVADSDRSRRPAPTTAEHCELQAGGPTGTVRL